MAACHVTVEVKVGPWVKKYMAELRYALDCADEIPDYVPEKRKLLRKVKRAYRELVINIKGNTDAAATDGRINE